MRLATLKERLLRGDIIEIYKIVNEQEEIDWIKFPNLRSDLEFTGPAMGV